MASVIDSITNMGITLPHLFQPAAVAASNDSFNASSPGNGTSPFPPGIVDTFLVSAGQVSPLMQLFVFIYRLLGAQLGLDPSVILTMLGFIWGLQKIGTQVYNYIMAFVDNYFMCAMFIGEYDHIYSQLMNWLSQQPSIRRNQYLMAQTVWKSAWEEEENEMENAVFYTDAGDGDDEEQRYLNFSSQAARSKPRYIPAMGYSSFWHNGTYFHVFRKKESFMNTSGWGGMKDLEEVKISCFGRSIEPIKQLLADAKTLYYHDTRQKTTIYRPRSKETRRDHNMWQQVARRPVRPMRTVVLDSKEKHEVLGDINEYLHPATPRWYASRGIPLRRGYLFHGPPGTGKTSFSFALAGVFGIDIYVISLQDVNVTEEDLASLFTRLPRRCIVLLEDIDTAGLKRDSDAEETDKEKTEDDEEKTAEEKEKDKQKEKGEGDEEKSEADKENTGDDKKEMKNEAAEEKVEPKVNGIKKGDATESKKAKADKDAKDAKDAEDAAESKTKKKNRKDKKKKKSRKSKKDDSDSDSGSDSDSDSDNSNDDDSDDDKKSRKKRKHRKGSRRHRSGGGNKVVSMESISLSGLLNAIDGVASHEGRVLIMTTNKPESLDEALIRPGRVDMQVAFRNATSTQAQELFYRMYEASGLQKGSDKAKQLTDAAEPTDEKALGVVAATAARMRQLDASAEELKGISHEFGRCIPEGMLSPAEVQGFLLKRKNSPRKALEEAPAWVEASLKQKESNSKVAKVQ